MVAIALFIVVAYLLSNFTYFTALREKYQKEGLVGTLNLSLAIFIHQVASLFIKG